MKDCSILASYFSSKSSIPSVIPPTLQMVLNFSFNKSFPWIIYIFKLVMFIFYFDFDSIIKYVISNTSSHSVFYWITWLFVLIGCLPDQTNFLNFYPGFILKCYPHSRTSSNFWTLVLPKQFSITIVSILCLYQQPLRQLVSITIQLPCIHAWYGQLVLITWIIWLIRPF
jgi:hypothetical protein